MIELTKHIETLLLENDCVIVPDFGGFIAHYQPAAYVEEENLYLPPVRTIGFNPQLTLNDGLLAQSYMQAYHTDYRDAMRRIEKAVDALNAQLYKEGHAELEHIGTLHYTLRHTYEFHPREEGALSPSLYGLSSYSIRKLEPMTAVLPTPQNKEERAAKQAQIIRMTRKWTNYAASVAVAILLFFVLSVPAENTYVEQGSYASLGTDELFEAIRSQSLATTVITSGQQSQPKKKAIRNNQNTLKPIAVKVEKVTPAESKPKAIESKPATESTPVASGKPATDKAPAGTVKPQATSVNPWCIIVSSLATAADANQVLAGYKQQGYKDATIVSGGGRYRIAIIRLADKAAAYQKLNELKKNEAFKNAWVLNSK